MKKCIMKRFLSLFLTFLMIFGNIPMDSFAMTVSGNEVEDETGDGTVSGNSAPVPVSGTKFRAKIKTDETYTIDVSSMFTDEQDDELICEAFLYRASGITSTGEYEYNTEIEAIDVNDGKCSVTISEIGIYALKITVSDGNLSATEIYQLTVVNNDAGIIKINAGITFDVYNAVVVETSEEVVDDAIIHHVVLSKDTLSDNLIKKMDVTIQDGYSWGKESANGSENHFSTGEDTRVFAYEPENETETVHYLKFHKECEIHTDADHNMICDSCTMEIKSAGSFALLVVNKNGFIIEPCYVDYVGEISLKDALKVSGYTFEGIDSGFISSIEGDVNGYSLYYDGGKFSLDTPAADISAVYFTSNSNQRYNDDLLNLTIQMVKYLTSSNGVKNYEKAKAAYETAAREFYSTKNASKLYNDLKNAMEKYDAYVNEESITVPLTITMDGQTITSGKALFQSEFESEPEMFSDWKNGITLKQGSYSFDISDGEFHHVRGTIEVVAGTKLAATLPAGQWLESLDLSIQSGDNWNAVNKDNATAASATYYVPDYSSTSLYPYAVCAVDGSAHKLFEVGSTYARTWKSNFTTLAHVIDANSLNNKSIVLEIRLMDNPDSYEQYQTFTLDIQRTPSLKTLTLGGDGTALKLDFDKEVKEYTVSTTSDSVDITAAALSDDAEITVAGIAAESNETVNVELTDDIKNEDGTYLIPVFATAPNGQTTTYSIKVVKMDALQITLSSPNIDASVELYNDAGAKVEPILKDDTHYTYNVLENAQYTYIVTEKDVYHATSKFKVTESQVISLPRPKVDENWLNALSLKAGSDSQVTAPYYELTPAFDASEHDYITTAESNTAVFYLKAFSIDTDAYKTEVIFKAHNNTQYKGREECKTIINTKHNRINQFLSNGGWGNDMLIRLTQNTVEYGVTYYQDYNIKVNRNMTLYDLSAYDNNGEALILGQKDSEETGFNKQKYNYAASVGATAEEMTVSFKTINTSMAYDYDQYEIIVKCGEYEEIVTYAEESQVMKEQIIEVPLNGTDKSEVIKVTVFHKGEGVIAGIYTIELTKLPAVITEIISDPIDATVFLTEELFGTRIYPEEDGSFTLMSGQKYKYVVTKYGYISASEIFVANENNERIDVILEKAADSTLGDIAVNGDWLQFRADSNNNGVLDVKTPIKAENAVLEWSNKIGDGFDSGATGCPIIVGGYIYTYAGNSIVKVDKDTGEIVDNGVMVASSSFAINSPTYAEGMIFVGLSDGRVQAFNAETLESLWVFTDVLGGQPNCPIVYHDGYIYTGFWNSEVSNANFVCISVTDEEPSNTTEEKLPTWTYTSNGFYWAGAYVNDDFILVGTDDGDSGYTKGHASILSLDPKTGMLLDEEKLTNVGDQRSSICYDEVTDAYYFTTKGGDFYQIMVDDEGKIVEDSLYCLHLDNYANSDSNPPMSTSTPVIYNGRAYIGVSGTSQFGAYSGHNITVIDLNTFSIAYTVPTQGYPQVSGLLTTAYEEDGYVYVYFIDNYTPGKIRVIRDNTDMTEVDHTYTTKESYINAGKTITIETGYVLFTPNGAEAQYAICSPIADAEGNLYFKNDSARMMKLSSKITEIEITKQPEKMKYDAGMTFDGTGMKVQAHYANGGVKDITNYVSYTKDPLTADDTEITVSFTPDKMFANEDTAKGGYWRWYQDSEGNVGKKYNLPTATVTIEIHVHQCTKVAAKSSTCMKAGNIEYYKCTGCKKFFADKNGKNEITKVTIPVVEHEYDSGKVTKKATVSSKGIKTYTCKYGCGKTKTETIYAASSMKLSTSTYVYNGSAKKPSVTVKTSEGKTLKAGTDYEVSYESGRKAVGRYKVTVTFKGSFYTGSKTMEFTIVPKKVSSFNATLAGYDGVKLTWKKSTGATGYLVYYKQASASKWSDPITVTGKTSYTKKNLADGVKYNFKVVPYYKTSSGAAKYFDEDQYRTDSIYTLKKISTPKLSTSGSKVKVKWTNIQGVTGYQISQSTSKSKTKIVETYKTTSGESKKVTATKGKKYYYKVRAYKVVDGKKVYGPWSDVKSYKR